MLQRANDSDILSTPRTGLSTMRMHIQSNELIKQPSIIKPQVQIIIHINGSNSCSETLEGGCQANITAD